MKLNESYVKRLKELDNPKFQSFITDKKICYLPDNNRGRLYENITRVDFNSLYTNIQIGLFNEGLIDKEWKEDIERVQWFLKNRKELKLLQSGEYEKWKIHCNSLYMKIKSPYVVEYVDMFYTDLIQKYGDLIIYNDVDSLYLKIDKVSFESKEWITELKDFKYDVEFINYLYLEDRKKYIEQEESGQINTKGFRDENVKQNLLNIIKREIRRRKLENFAF
jgi:DNA polymerase elongation subunit (family B)